MNYPVLLLLEADWSWLTSPPVISGVVGLVVGVPGYYFGKRGRNASVHKTEAEANKAEVDSIKVLSECTASLSAQLLVAHNEMPLWSAKITAETQRADAAEAKANECEKALAVCENREPLGIETANMLRTEAASIIENVNAISFVPLGKPNPEMENVVRRLMEMRLSAERMRVI